MTTDREDSRMQRPTEAATWHSRGHIPALDGLRGLAVLMVMLCHFTANGLPDTLTGKFVHRVFDAGASGVDLFFVLSGFLITGILYDAKDAPHYFRSYYARRVLRIFPLYYGFLIAFFWILPHLHAFTPAMQQVSARQGWLWGYGANLVMAREARWIFDVDWLKLGHFWTLAIEEQFYLVWPFLVFLLPRKQMLRVCVACIVVAFIVRMALVAHGARPITVGMLTVSRIDALAAGGLAALLLRGRAADLYEWARVGTPLIGAAMLALVVWREGWDASDPVVQTVGFSLLAIFCTGLLLRTIEPGRAGWLTRIFAHPVMRWFGTYSYAMYVFHVALMPLLERAAPVADLSRALASSYLGVAAFTGFAISVTSVAALASWHLFEKHFLALKRHFPSGHDARVTRSGLEQLGEGQVAVAVAGHQ